ncbi:MAG: DUF5596 domain-containing protein [Lentisphaeria bacterium]|nr:DUF5596 domain-containing protein [Lentisphaeria bacterium]
MTPEAVLTDLGDTSALANVRLHWDLSMAEMPAGDPDFLRDEVWRSCSRYCGFGDALDGVLARVAEAARETPALRLLAWHAYWRVFLSPETCPPNGWPEPERHLGEDAGGLLLLVALGFVPLLRAKHREWGIPEEVTRETAQQVRCYCDDAYRRGHAGRPGVYPGPLAWLRHYTREKYVRLGRFEYWLGPNPHRIEVFRHRRSGRVMALAPDGTRFARDGSIYRDPGDYAPGEGWTATLQHTTDGVAGCPIDPRGAGTPGNVLLAARDWECVLKHGDPSLMMHIPSGGRMTPEACRESLLQAAGFFPRFFPQSPPRAVVCASWIFSPPLQDIFGGQANLSVFQKNLYLFPVPSGPWDGLWFVFLQNGPLDLERVPCETSLQRGIRDYLRQGHRWRCGGMFFLLDDLPRFGTEPYLKDWLPTP